MIGCNYCTGGCPLCQPEKFQQSRDQFIQYPYCCPVCQGRGVVHAGFYTGGDSISTTSEVCRSCSGTGIIWR